jgi:AraC-like DNA-binding protein
MAKENRITYENPMIWLKITQPPRKIVTTEWRYMKEIKLYFILKGKLEIQIQEEKFELNAGDLFLIGPSELHRDRCDRPEELDHIVLYFYHYHFFDPSTLHFSSYFSNAIRPLSQLNYIFRENIQAKEEIIANLQHILRESEAKQIGYELMISSQVKNMFVNLLRYDSRKLLISYSSMEISRLRPVLDYVEKRLNEKIKVEDLCKQMNMSYHYFVKYFKKITGVPFIEYINRKKIKRAEELVLTTNRSIMDIGIEVGLPNMTHFYDLFKRYNGCSPKQFRKRKEEWKL